jgi:hypothetical protein
MRKLLTYCIPAIIISSSLSIPSANAAGGVDGGVDSLSQIINPTDSIIGNTGLEGGAPEQAQILNNGSNDLVIGLNTVPPVTPPVIPAPQPVLPSETFPQIDQGGTPTANETITNPIQDVTSAGPIQSTVGSNNGAQDGEGTNAIKDLARTNDRISCDLVSFSGGTSGGCASISPPVVPPTPGNTGGTPGDGNSNLIEVLQSSVLDAVGSFNPPAQDLFFAAQPGAVTPEQLGALAPAGGQLTPEQLGALAPAAGGNAGTGSLEAGDDSIACMNSYLQNGWSSQELRSRCGGSGGESTL